MNKRHQHKETDESKTGNMLRKWLIFRKKYDGEKLGKGQLYAKDSNQMWHVDFISDAKELLIIWLGIILYCG